MKTRSYKFLALLITLSVLLISCSAAGIKGFEVNKSDLYITVEEDMSATGIIVVKSDGDFTGDDLTFTSSDPSIATVEYVSQLGNNVTFRVNALKVGQTTANVSSGKVKSEHIFITVVAKGEASADNSSEGSASNDTSSVSSSAAESTASPDTSESTSVDTSSSANSSDTPSSETSQPVQSSDKVVPALKTSVPQSVIDSIPAFDGKNGYYVINKNNPYFSAEELTDKSYEYYSSLDSLGRCGVCVVSVGVDLMPTENRGSISEVKPTGWVQASYPTLKVNYLYNRSHLIAFMLTGENANRSNLITGTTYFNQTTMVRFEDMVHDYVKDTGNHVLYRVTPIFKGNDLVARGVTIEAYSVEDDGDGICMCVFIYNVQPGVVIDYATGASHLEGEDPAETSVDETVYTFILNTSSKKFHLTTCSSVSKMSEANKQTYTGTIAALLADEYVPCGTCHPDKQ